MWKLGKLWLALRKELALAWLMLRDPRTPMLSKAAIVADINMDEFLPLFPLTGGQDAAKEAP